MIKEKKQKRYDLDPLIIVELAKKILNENKFNFDLIDILDIQFVRVIGENPKKYADIRKISYPASLFTHKKYLISFYDSFEDLTLDKKEIVIAHELMHIDAEHEKLIQHDIQDFRQILEIYGVNWEKQ